MNTESTMLMSDKTVDGTKIKDLTHGSEKRVRYKCDDCGYVGDRSWNNHQVSIRRWGKLTFCKSCASKRNAKERIGRPAWNRGRSGPKGKDSPSWKGGTYVDASGYRMVYNRDNGKKHAVGWNNYAKEHVLIMEKHLGRRIKKDEVVHHLDGDKLNNSIDNLFITKQSGHRGMHVSLQEIGYELFRNGLITFDRKSARYVAHKKLRELLEHPGGGNQQPRRSRKRS